MTRSDQPGNEASRADSIAGGVGRTVEAATEPYRHQAAAAIAPIQRFAEQSSPHSLQQMKDQYYAFTNEGAISLRP